MRQLDPATPPLPSAPRARHAPLMVHDGGTGIRAYLSLGVSTLVAIMAAHRTAAGEAAGECGDLQNEIDRIAAALAADPEPGGLRATMPRTPAREP